MPRFFHLFHVRHVPSLQITSSFLASSDLRFSQKHTILLASFIQIQQKPVKSCEIDLCILSFGILPVQNISRRNPPFFPVHPDKEKLPDMSVIIQRPVFCFFSKYCLHFYPPHLYLSSSFFLPFPAQDHACHKQIQSDHSVPSPIRLLACPDRLRSLRHLTAYAPHQKPFGIDTVRRTCQ